MHLSTGNAPSKYWQRLRAKRRSPGTDSLVRRCYFSATARELHLTPGDVYSFSPPDRLNEVERFLSRVKVVKARCWLFASDDSLFDYPSFRPVPLGPRVTAFRWVWEFMHARAIPKGFVPDHLCRFKRCVNPAHLELVTVAENVRRARSS